MIASRNDLARRLLGFRAANQALTVEVKFPEAGPWSGLSRTTFEARVETCDAHQVTVRTVGGQNTGLSWPLAQVKLAYDTMHYRPKLFVDTR